MALFRLQMAVLERTFGGLCPLLTFLLFFVSYFLFFLYFLSFFSIFYDTKSLIFIDHVDVFNDFVILSCALSCFCIFTDFWSFWDLPRHQKEVHRSNFSPFGRVLGAIWGRPWELLKVSWAQDAPKSPQDLPKRPPDLPKRPPRPPKTSKIVTQISPKRPKKVTPRTIKIEIEK